MLSAGEVDTGGIPDVGAAGAECDIPGIIHLKMPGERATVNRPRSGITDGCSIPDHDGLVAVARGGQAFLLFCRQHGRRVLQLAGTGDDHIPGYGDPVVEVAVFVIEFACAQEGEGIPALPVVVYAHPRIPLSDLIDLAVAGRYIIGAV